MSKSTRFTKRNTFRAPSSGPIIIDADFPPLISRAVATPVPSDTKWVQLAAKNLPEKKKPEPESEAVIQQPVIPQVKPFDMVAWYNRMHKEVGYEEDDHLDYFQDYEGDY